ncbi:MAG: hypothetical protein AAGU75_02445, partial [Bacillota bacterium]
LFGAYRPELPANEKTNVLKIEQATLVSNTNAQDVADRIYDYYQNRYQGEGPIVLGDEEPGQMKIMDSMNSRQLEGIIESLDIDLTGGFIANIKITGKLYTYGYSVSITVKTDWVNTDKPTSSQINRIRDNANALLTGYHKLTGSPDIRYWDSLDYSDVNSLEQNILNIDTLLIKMIADFRFSGEICSGEDDYS